jgi:glycosyltransferase involved in cell wall biosynthesis
MTRVVHVKMIWNKFIRRGLGLLFVGFTGHWFRRASAAVSSAAPGLRAVAAPYITKLHAKLASFAPIILPLTEPAGTRGRLLIDVSTTFNMVEVSGIQRTVRSLIYALKLNSDKYGLEPIPVRLKRVGRNLQIVSAVNFPDTLDDGVPIAIRPGDHVFMLDSSWDIYSVWAETFPLFRASGGKIITCIFDLLPLSHPHYFTSNLCRVFEDWYATVLRESDLILAISQATQDEMKRYSNLKISHDYFHLGADFKANNLSFHDSQKTPKNFLTVGTIEPRKGHATVIAAFEILWEKGYDINLVFVGKTGWLVEPLIERFRVLTVSNPRFSYNGYLTDECLAEIYQISDVVIAASDAEGFGLPLVEALRLGKRVIASDIPAFREVGGGMVLYFSPGDAVHLSLVLEQAILKPSFQVGSKPTWLTWSESADALMEKIFKYISASDERF